MVEDIVIEGINHGDYPDYCDAFIVSATYNGRKMTEREIEDLPDDFVYEKVLEWIEL